MDTVWIVGRHVWDHEQDTWELQGVFLTEASAVEACRDEEYFVGSVPVGVSLPHDTTAWPVYYPLDKG